MLWIDSVFMSRNNLNCFKWLPCRSTRPLGWVKVLQVAWSHLMTSFRGPLGRPFGWTARPGWPMSSSGPEKRWSQDSSECISSQTRCPVHQPVKRNLRLKNWISVLQNNGFTRRRAWNRPYTRVIFSPFRENWNPWKLKEKKSAERNLWP